MYPFYRAHPFMVNRYTHLFSDCGLQSLVTGRRVPCSIVVYQIRVRDNSLLVKFQGVTQLIWMYNNCLYARTLFLVVISFFFTTRSFISQQGYFLIRCVGLRIPYGYGDFGRRLRTVKCGHYYEKIHSTYLNFIRTA